MLKRSYIFFAAIFGNILEYYEFTVYAVFSITIGKVFFAATNPTVQVMSSLACFAIGFVTRPIGGIFFGYIADKHGRRISLIISILGMALPTFVIGFLPSYEKIGILAPILLACMRMLQGLCISGEGTGTAIFVLEHYHNIKPGLIAGAVHSTNIIGTLIASAVGIYIKTYVSDPNAWRYAFLMGGVFGLFGFYLRLKVSETPIFQQINKNKKRVPIFDVISKSWRYMLITFATAAVASSITQLVKAYINIFYATVMHMPESSSLKYAFYANFVMMVTMPLFGLLGDTIGNIRALVTAVVSIIIFTIPAMMYMGSESYACQILCVTTLGALAGGVSASAYLFVISVFPPEQRATGVGFSYNLGITFFGGTSAFISAWLVKNTSLNYAPGIYIISTAVLFMVIFIIYKYEIEFRSNRMRYYGKNIR